MIRIAPSDDEAQQETLIDMLLDGANQSEIRTQIDSLKNNNRRRDGATNSATKPKRVYRTKYDIVIIAQSTTKQLTQDHLIGALQEALGRATNPGAGIEDAGTGSKR